ncbi:GNAT family N-acetyltransferase [Fulvivirga maritima]|uniref:GNAT family N-acetyltransferase n=1 Tax=Fulvivirga maritima TaxID=2904247 RepID=UPI001F2B7165|nr:GNAT family N-acetyltransferase [Fulvivirga maritima]UII27464.1 GNAT family N-acetyltransferase [Fulvivirga maritima]
MEILKIPHHQTWALRHKVMWPDKPLDYVKLENDESGLHYGLFIDGELTSVISLFIENGTGQFRKFATQATEQGKGYGSRLLHFLFEEVQNQNLTEIWCNARVDKAGFYQKFGMRTTDKQFTKGGIDYVIMKRNIK